MAQSKLEKNFTEISQEILQNLQSFFPISATERGIHDYDYKYTDYSKNSINSEIKKLTKFETRLYKYNKSVLSSESRINLKLLKSDVDIALQDLKGIKWHKKNPYLYVNEAINGIYLIMASDYAPMSTRVQNIIARLKTAPDLFRQARSNLQNPPPVFIEMAQEMIPTGIDFFRSVETELAGKFPELAQEIHSSAGQAIVALQEYSEFLGNIVPGPENSFAIGVEDFNYKLLHQYFLDYDADSLLKIGEKLFDETKREYENYLAQLDVEPLNNDSVYVIDCISKEDVLDYYRWEVEQTKLFMKEHDIATIPDDFGECKVVETPPFLTNVISSIAYQPPGTFSPVQTGMFYVRPLPANMDEQQREARYRYIQRRGFKGSVVHEAYPGHHFQFVNAARINDPVRKWHENACFYEGWALYCEEMMYDQGFYGADKRRYLNILRGVLFRAARIIVDVKLHTGQMSIDEAVEWMANALDRDISWIRVEVKRYAMTPTIQMAYLIGKLQILQMRDDLKAREGENFTLKSFHDRLMTAGSQPPPIVREILGLD